ncbi:MAG: type II toxin-antitoxin system VapC family toxin, partial [Thermoprotei archaeon]
MRTGNIRRLVIDTYAWIEFFIGSKKGEMVKDYLLGENEVYTPSIVLAEIARKYLQENMTEKIVRKRLELIAKISIVIDIDEKLALETGKAYLELVKHAKNIG